MSSCSQAADNPNDESVVFLAETKKPQIKIRKRPPKIVLKEHSVPAAAEKSKLRLMKKIYPLKYK